MTNSTNGRESRRYFAIAWAFLAASFFLIGTTSRIYADAGDDVLNTGLSQHKNQEYDKAIETFENYIRQYPQARSRNQAELFAGHSFMCRQQYTTTQDANAAQQHFNYILNQGSSATYYKEALFHTSHLAYNMRDYNNAVGYLNQFISKYPDDAYTPFAYYYLANCESQLGNAQSSITNYEKALSVNQDKDSSIRWNCLLERAILIGKYGDYTTAENELQKLDQTSGLPIDIAAQVAVQRAMLQFVQLKFQNAITLLEDFIKKARALGNNQAVTNAVQTASLYEAYALFGMKNYDGALTLIKNAFETNSNTLPPEPAMLKIKLYVATKRINEAENVLRTFASSEYGQKNPDAVTSYTAFVNLMKGDYDSVINALMTMLAVQQRGYVSRSNYLSPQYDQNNSGYNSYNAANNGGYNNYNTANNGYNNGGYNNNNGYANAAPNHSVSYGNAQNNNTNYSVPPTTFAPSNDQNNSQQSGSNTSYSVGSNPNSPNIGSGSMLVTVGYFSKAGGQYLEPIDCVEAAGTLVLAFASRYAKTKNNMDLDYQDAIYNETRNFAAWTKEPTIELVVKALDNKRRAAVQRPIAESNDPSYVVVPYIYNQYNQTPGKFDSPTGTTYQRPDYYIYGATNNSYRPNDYYSSNNYNWNNNNTPNAYTPNNNQNQNSNNQQGQQGQQNQQGQQQQGQQNQQGQQQQGQQNQQGQQQQGQQSSKEEETHVTLADAQRALEKGEMFFRNQEFSRCNETLLETLLSSESFWQDCPSVAPRVALLRGNALIMLGKRSEAQMSYQDVINNAPGTPEAAMAATFIGLNYDMLGRREEAVKYLRRATSVSVTTPFSDAALYYLGLNERERGNIEVAKQAFQRIYRDYPDSSYWSHAVWALAEIERDERDDKTAERLVNEALANKPDAAIVDYLLFLKGELALTAKDYTKALIAFDMIVDQYPDSVFYSKARNRIAAVPEKYRGEQTALEGSTPEPAQSQTQRPSREPSTQSRPRPTQKTAPSQLESFEEEDEEEEREVSRPTRRQTTPSTKNGALPKATPGQLADKSSSTSSKSTDSPTGSNPRSGSASKSSNSPRSL